MSEFCDVCGKEIAKGEKVFGKMSTHWIGGNRVTFEEIFYHQKCAIRDYGESVETRTVSKWKIIFKEKRVSDSPTVYRRM